MAGVSLDLCADATHCGLSFPPGGVAVDKVNGALVVCVDVKGHVSVVGGVEGEPLRGPGVGPVRGSSQSWDSHGLA